MCAERSALRAETRSKRQRHQEVCETKTTLRQKRGRVRSKHWPAHVEGCRPERAARTPIKDGPLLAAIIAPIIEQ